MMWLALLLACGDKHERTDEVTLDCDGMVPMMLLGWKTATLARDDRSGTMNPRCLVAPSDTLSGGPVALTSEWFAPPDQMLMRVATGGKLYYSVGGEAELSEVEDGRAAGSFEMEARAFDIVTEEWDEETTTIRGDFDWCASALHPDCPAGYEDVLERPMSITSPILGRVEASAAACRMMWDEPTGSLRVDLAIGYWAGVNVGQLWVSECTGGEGPVLPNSLVFRAAGVSGPGTYGPQASATFPSGRLPELRWTHPMVFDRSVDSPALACTAYYDSADAWLGDDSECTWTVEEGTGGVGRFELDCTEVRHVGDSGLISRTGKGDFHLESACDWVPR